MRRARDIFADHSGPKVALLFHRLLGLVLLDAWLSLGAQVHLLIGARGLLPIAPFLAGARQQLSWHELPTLFWLGVTDTTLTLGIVAGVGLALAALVGRALPYVQAAQVALYLSFTVACRTFLSFQWDNLILECAFFSVILPRDRRAPLAHILFRLILFKLYFESGIAKWQSQLGDWQDGSAMTYYYETAPLPTALAWYMHHLPAGWHHLESWCTLFLELVVPFFIFGPRALRIAAAVLLSGFQIVNVATANYGFFCYLALALHVFLLDEGDLRWPRRPLAEPAPSRVAKVAAPALLAFFLLASLVDAGLSFFRSERLAAALLPPSRVYAPFRVVNSYHLFGSITRARIEPDVQVSLDGKEFTALEFRHKPGAPGRRPDFVAPHQPRVDFQLWFYGLSYRSGAPEYVAALVTRLCRDPGAVAPLFSTPPPAAIKAVHIVYWQYHFTSAAERHKSGAWWRREPVDVTGDIACDAL